MNVVLVVSAISLIGFGLYMVFAKDSFWNYVQWRNRNMGVKSERTSQWNISSTLGGVALVILGVWFAIMSSSLGSPRPDATMPRTIVSINGHSKELSAEEEQEFKRDPEGFMVQHANEIASEPRKD